MMKNIMSWVYIMFSVKVLQIIEQENSGEFTKKLRKSATLSPSISINLIIDELLEALKIKNELPINKIRGRGIYLSIVSNKLFVFCLIMIAEKIIAKINIIEKKIIPIFPVKQ